MPTIYDFDGYEDYATAGRLRENLRSLYGSIVSGGRNGGSRLSCVVGSTARALPVAVTTLAVGAYIELPALPFPVLEFRSVTSGEVQLFAESDGSVSARRCGAGGWSDLNPSANTLLGTSAPNLIHVSVPFHMQMKAVMHAATGSVEVRINGVVALTLSNINTIEVSGSLTHVAMGNGYFDDYYAASDFLGDRRVDSHKPTEDGTNQDGTPSSAGAHYAMVDEMPEPDNDTSYVTLAAASDRESYGCEDFKNPGAPINAVMVVVDAKKTDAGAATMAPSIFKGSDHDGATVGLATDYTRIKEIYETDPDTTDPWDEAGFEAAEFGALKVA
jgi:hypothetical protein